MLIEKENNGCSKTRNRNTDRERKIMDAARREIEMLIEKENLWMQQDEKQKW